MYGAYTVEGELSVARFLVNYFSGVYFQTLVAVHSCPVSKLPLLLSAEAELAVYPNILPHQSFLPSFSTARVSAFVSAIIAPQLNAAQHILIKTLLKEGFETKLIATEVLCSVRAVQRIRLKRQQSEMSRKLPQEQNASAVGSCITLPMQKALCNRLSNSLTCIDARWQTSSVVGFVKRYRTDRSVGLCDQ
jgi:hypothetical protein